MDTNGQQGPVVHATRHATPGVRFARRLSKFWDRMVRRFVAPERPPADRHAKRLEQKPCQEGGTQEGPTTWTQTDSKDRWCTQRGTPRPVSVLQGGCPSFGPLLFY
jgi:hypothetical protein